MTLFEEIIEDLKAYEPDSPYENITDRLLSYLHKQHIRRLGNEIKSAKEGW